VIELRCFAALSFFIADLDGLRDFADGSFGGWRENREVILNVQFSILNFQFSISMV
jgi:hypothetical protein